jgi:hypothetical protein
MPIDVVAGPPPVSRRRASALNLGSYTVAGLIIWLLARGTPLQGFAYALAGANFALFVPTALASIILWIAADATVYSRLFTYFHRPTGFNEMLPIAAAHESLQLVNGFAAGVSLAWLVQMRKAINWLAVGWTLALLGFVDLNIVVWWMLTAASIDRKAMLGFTWYYPAIFAVGSAAFAALWLRGRPRSRLGRWLYGLPSMTAFRKVRPIHYFKLALVRIPTFAVQGLVLYLEMIAFRIRCPFSAVMIRLPLVLIASALPFVPSGLGTRQAAIVVGFEEFGSRTALLTMSLAHSWVLIVGSMMKDVFIHAKTRMKVASLPIGAED